MPASNFKAITWMIHQELQRLISDIYRVSTADYVGSLEIRCGLLGVRHVAEYAKETLFMADQNIVEALAEKLVEALKALSGAPVHNRPSDVPWFIDATTADMLEREELARVAYYNGARDAIRAMLTNLWNLNLIQWDYHSRLR